jgi:hypothetical protein
MLLYKLQKLRAYKMFLGKNCYKDSGIRKIGKLGYKPSRNSRTGSVYISKPLILTSSSRAYFPSS